MFILYILGTIGKTCRIISDSSRDAFVKFIDLVDRTTAVFDDAIDRAADHADHTTTSALDSATDAAERAADSTDRDSANSL